MSLLRPDDVAQRVVLLVQGEQTGIRDLRVLSDTDFFLSFKQKERLEGWRCVHLCYRSGSDAANDRKLFLRNKMTISAFALQNTISYKFWRNVPL